MTRVVVANLNVREMLKSDKNGRNTAEMGWRDFITILNHHGRKRGCHVVEVAPEDTTKACHECGVKTKKPLWVREHSWPACGFETDRDHNAALNVWDRGLRQLGVVHPEDTLVETATAVDADEFRAVSASRVCRGTLDRLSDAV